MCVCVALSGLFSSSHGVVQGFRKGMWLENLSRAAAQAPLSSSMLQQAAPDQTSLLCCQSIQPHMVVNHVNFQFSSRKTPAFRYFFSFPFFQTVQFLLKTSGRNPKNTCPSGSPVFLPGTQFFLSAQTDLIWKKLGIQHIRHYLLC